MAFVESVPRSLFDHLLEGFQVISPEWVYLYVNPAAASQGRSTPSQLEGKKMWEAYPGIENSPLFEVMKRVMGERAPTTIENLFTFPDGTQRRFEIRLEPVPQGLCIHSLDIEDRKRAEESLRTLNEQLEERVAQRTYELERSNRDLKAFCFSVSHDLRTPLRAIEGFSALLAENAAGILDAEGREHLSRIQAAGSRMGRLIDELLELARVGNTELTRKPVDLSAMAQAVADELRAAEPTRAVTWCIDAGLSSRCDPVLALMAMRNLLDNAWKFTSKTPNAVIEVRASTEAPAAITITDNGAGFDMAFAASLFKPFRRLHREREFPGTGIGLATVHRIVERHGGSIQARAEVGRGASFTISFEQ